MLREVKEEAGIQLDTWKYLRGWPNEYSHKSIVNDVYFLARVENFQSVQTCSGEINGIFIENPGTINTGALTILSLKIAAFAYLHNGYRS